DRRNVLAGLDRTDRQDVRSFDAGPGDSAVDLVGVARRRRVDSEWDDGDAVAVEPVLLELARGECRWNDHDVGGTARHAQSPGVKRDTVPRARHGETQERDVVHGDDERATANRRDREARRMDEVGIDVDARPREAMPELVADASVRSSEVDPRGAGR